MTHSYAFFDFDGTLIGGDSIIRFCLFARRRGFATGRDLLRAGALGALYGLKLVSAERSKQGALRFLKGKTRKEVAALSRAFCEEELLPNLYPEGVEAIRRHRRQGRHVWLVTASTGFYLEPLCRKLGVERLIATRMHVDASGVYSGLIDGHNCRGVEKTLRIAEALAAAGEDVDYATSWAYGDTGGDAPMLMLCQHKMAVNPRRKLVKALASAEGVERLCWKKKTPPRDGRAHGKR